MRCSSGPTNTSTPSPRRSEGGETHERKENHMNTLQLTQEDAGDERPFLPPIEMPEGLIKKLAYHFTRRQFGKVLTPLKVHSARLPAAFGMFYAKIGKLDKKLTISLETVMLVREQVARI